MSPLDRLAEALEGRIGRQILDALKLIQLGINLQLIERLILQRQIEEIVRTVGWPYLQNVLAEAQRQLVPVAELAWQQTIEALPQKLTVQGKLSLGSYAQANPNTVAELTRLNLSRIQGITLESQEAVRRVLLDGIAKGLNPRDVARNLRDIVGLNQRQTQTLNRYRAMLEAQDRTPAQIGRMVARKRQALLVDRSENIARTETMTAIQDSKMLQRERLVREGTIKSGDWEVEWITAGDERTCPICLPLNGVRTPIGGVFNAGTGVFDAPPAHPRCRCDTRTVLKGFRAGRHPSPVRRDILRSLGTAA